jgi:hypothetical protein
MMLFLYTENRYLRSNISSVLVICHQLSLYSTLVSVCPQDDGSYILSSIRVAVLLPVDHIIELIRTHGSDEDIPEFNKRRKTSKETYIAILLDVLSRKFEYDLPAVRDFLTTESTKITKVKKKGFGAK